jgi:hypothetical protein
MERAGLAPGTVLESSKGPVMNESQYSPDVSGSHVSTPALGLPDPAVIHAAALRYAEMGWRVFPITKERIPLIKEFPTIPAPSVEQVNRWWGDGRKYEHPQIGLATGDQGDGRVVFVIDVDVKEGVDGRETLADHEAEHGPLPDTVRAISGGGWSHYYFTAPPGTKIRTDSSKCMGPGIDVRGHGGYIVLAPSWHIKTGNLYQWEIGFDPWEHQIAAAPQWVLDKVTQKERQQVERAPRPALDISDLEKLTNADWLRAVSQSDTYPALRWESLLEAEKWKETEPGSTPNYWTRPGKETKEGHSAELHPDGRLAIFSGTVLSTYPTADGKTIGTEHNGEGRSFSVYDFLLASRFSGDHKKLNRWIEEQRGRGLGQLATRTTTTAGDGGGWEVVTSGRRGPNIERRILDFYHQNYRTIRDPIGDVFAVPREGLPLASRLSHKSHFAAHLSSQWAAVEESLITSTRLLTVFTTIRGDREVHAENVHLRAADVTTADSRSVYIDLGNSDGDVVTITADGWHLTPGAIAQGSPVVFRRTPSMNEIPAPAPVPSDLHPAAYLDQILADHINVNEQQRRLIIGWLMAVYLNIARPILWFGGEQGTGKSTAARMLAQLVDPVGQEGIRQFPRDTEQLLSSFTNAHLAAFDNCGWIRPEMSDQLAAAVTGSDMERRELFFDHDVLRIYAIKKAVLITSIEANGGQGDLMSRLLPISFEYVSETGRKAETSLTARWSYYRPQIYGALCDLIAVALAGHRNQITAPRHTRFPDFDNLLAALDQATGWTTAADYLALSANTQAEIVSGDPVAIAITEIVAMNGGRWEAATSEILEQVNRRRPEHSGKGWPDNARAMGRKLVRISPALRAFGCEPEKQERNRGTLWTFTTRAPEPDRADSALDPVTPPEPVAVGPVDTPQLVAADSPPPMDRARAMAILSQMDE